MPGFVGKIEKKRREEDWLAQSTLGSDGCPLDPPAHVYDSTGNQGYAMRNNNSRKSLGYNPK